MTPNCSAFLHKVGGRCHDGGPSIRIENENGEPSMLPGTFKTSPLQARRSTPHFNIDNTIESDIELIDSEVPLHGGKSTLETRDDEPYLYNIPSSISPIYRSVPTPLKLGVWLLAALSSGMGLKKFSTPAQMFRILARVLLRGILASILLQEFF